MRSQAKKTPTPTKVEIIGSDVNLKLPSIIRYYDEVTDEDLTLRNPVQSDIWKLQVDSMKKQLDFTVIPTGLRLIAKYYLGMFLVNQQSHACVDYYGGIKSFLSNIQDIDIECCDLHQLRSEFERWKVDKNTLHYAHSARLFLVFLANIDFGDLCVKDAEAIKSWPAPQPKAHQRIRSGSHKLSFYEELQVTNYLTSCVERLKGDSLISSDSASKSLANAVLTVCFCLGSRPKQLAMLKISDIRAYDSEVAHSYYDIAISVIKQKKSQKEHSRKALPTKWQKIVLLWWEFRKSMYPESEWGTTPLFSLNGRVSAPPEFTRIIKELTGKILDEPKTVYNFRHTFAQRMADSGCSATEVATALTHSTTETAQVYVESSPDMARIISEAIGKSEVYKDVPDLFAGRLVIKPEYDTAPDENKVEGVVDGTWMPGIGLCDVSIKLCDKSPILACHTCPKFMPLLDKEPHEALAGQLRGIVYRFADTQVDQNKAAPPLAKLGGTLAVIEKLLVEIEETA